MGSLILVFVSQFFIKFFERSFLSNAYWAYTMRKALWRIGRSRNNWDTKRYHYESDISSFHRTSNYLSESNYFSASWRMGRHLPGREQEWRKFLAEAKTVCTQHVWKNEGFLRPDTKHREKWAPSSKQWEWQKYFSMT